MNPSKPNTGIVRVTNSRTGPEPSRVGPNSKQCPHRHAIENVSWHRVVRIARSLRTFGCDIPFGGEGRHVRDFLFGMFEIHGHNWLPEVNRFVARMEQQQMGKEQSR